MPFFKKMMSSSTIEALLTQQQKQFSTEEANKSRLVTKLRWVVESANGRIKNIYKFFDNVINNKYLNSLGDLFAIACALINKYRPSIAPNKPEHQELAQRILQRMDLSNLLQEFVQMNSLDTKRVVWISVDSASLTDFSILSEEDLRDVCMGVYQIKQAKSYSAVNFTEEDAMVFYYKEAPDIVRFKIASRHHSNKEYQCFIHYQPNGSGIEFLNSDSNIVVSSFC